MKSCDKVINIHRRFSIQKPATADTMVGPANESRAEVDSVALGQSRLTGNKGIKSQQHGKGKACTQFFDSSTNEPLHRHKPPGESGFFVAKCTEKLPADRVVTTMSNFV